jgi:hypothetical protein
MHGEEGGGHGENCRDRRRETRNRWRQANSIQPKPVRTTARTEAWTSGAVYRAECCTVRMKPSPSRCHAGWRIASPGGAGVVEALVGNANGKRQQHSRRAGKRWRACEMAGCRVVGVSLLGARWLQGEFRGVKTSNLLPNAAHMTGHALRKSAL